MVGTWKHPVDRVIVKGRPVVERFDDKNVLRTTSGFKGGPLSNTTVELHSVALLSTTFTEWLHKVVLSHGCEQA